MSRSPAYQVLEGEPPSRLPVAPVVVADHAARLAGVPLPAAVRDGRLLAEVLLNAHREYDPDLVVVFADVTVEAEALGAEIAWDDRSPPLVAGHPGPGAIRPLDPDRDGRLPVVLDAARRVMDAVGDEVPVLVSLKGPFSLAALVAGFELLLTDAVENPDRAAETLGRATECQVAYVRAVVRDGGIPLIGDPFASGSVLGPDHFEALALPGLRAMVEEVHAAGRPAAIHVCGDVRPVLDRLLLAGADLYHLEHADPGAVAAAGAVFMGGVPTEVLTADGEVSVEAAVSAALDAAPDRARYILATACDVPTDADPSRVKAMVREGRRRG